MVTVACQSEIMVKITNNIEIFQILRTEFTMCIVIFTEQQIKARPYLPKSRIQEF